MVTEGGVEGDRVEVGIAALRQRRGAQHDYPAGIELPAAVTLHAVARHQRAGRAQQQDSATLGVHRRVPALRAELVVLEHAVVPDGGVAGSSRLSVVEDQDALTVPADPVAHHEDLPGVPDEDPELVADGPVVAHDRVGVWRVPDVEPGLMVADRGVVGEQGSGRDKPRYAVGAVIDRHDPRHAKAVGAVPEHPVSGEAGDRQGSHRVTADRDNYRAGLRIDHPRQDAHPRRAERDVAERLREGPGRFDDRPAAEITRPAQRDPVRADLNALVVHPRPDQYRVAGPGPVDRGLDGLSGPYHDRP
jgi:hypothetical protein